MGGAGRGRGGGGRGPGRPRGRLGWTARRGAGGREAWRRGPAALGLAGNRPLHSNGLCARLCERAGVSVCVRVRERRGGAGSRVPTTGWGYQSPGGEGSPPEGWRAGLRGAGAGERPADAAPGVGRGAGGRSQALRSAVGAAMPGSYCRAAVTGPRDLGEARAARLHDPAWLGARRAAAAAAPGAPGVAGSSRAPARRLSGRLAQVTGAGRESAQAPNPRRRAERLREPARGWPVPETRRRGRCPRCPPGARPRVFSPGSPGATTRCERPAQMAAGRCKLGGRLAAQPSPTRVRALSHPGGPDPRGHPGGATARGGSSRVLGRPKVGDPGELEHRAGLSRCSSETTVSFSVQT